MIVMDCFKPWISLYAYKNVMQLNLMVLSFCGYCDIEILVYLLSCEAYEVHWIYVINLILKCVECILLINNCNK